MPPPKRRKELERPDLKYKSFIVFLKGPQFTQGSYDSLWDFDTLLKWILEKKPTLSRQRILCWTELTVRNPEYAELREHKLDEKFPCFFTDQSSWDAAVMAAQTNRMMGDQFSGISLKAASAEDPTVPAHSNEDVIVSEETGGGVVGKVAPSEILEVAGSGVATESEISDDEDVEEFDEVVDDGALAAAESPVPGTTKPRKRP